MLPNNENTAVSDTQQLPPNMHTSPAKSRLIAKSIYKSYGKKEAVKGVSFKINQGQVTGLLGPNGAGKTTLFHILVGFIHANRGAIYLNEENISAYPMYRRAQQGIIYLPQESSIFRKLTVRENIMAVLQYRSDLDKSARKTALQYLLNRFSIESIAHQKADTLSGGERKRTEIARSLARDPQFLLLDEPFTGIDPITISAIKRIVYHLAKDGKGIVITDHNVIDTLDITDYTYIIAHGTIIAQGVPSEIVEDQSAREIYFGETLDPHTHTILRKDDRYRR